MRYVLPVLVVSGCSFTAPPPSTMAPPGDDDGAVDAPPAASDDAAMLGEWGEPVLVANLDSAQNDDDPSLTSDLLEIYFASTRTPVSPDEDIYVARRASPADDFGPPELVPAINTQFLESNVDVSGDGLALVFTSNRDGDPDLYITTRPDRSSPWGPVVPLAELNSPGGEFGAVLGEDKLRIILCSNRGGDEALYAATRAAIGQPFGPPTKLPELDTPADECDGMSPAGSQTIYFTRAMGPGDLDLYVAGPTFAASVPVSALNTAMRDGDPWVSPDQRVMFFASNRAGGTTDDIYMSTR